MGTNPKNLIKIGLILDINFLNVNIGILVIKYSFRSLSHWDVCLYGTPLENLKNLEYWQIQGALLAKQQARVLE